MPRNGAGTYTLPAGNPVVANTNITADWGNATMEDIGNEITNSLSREGDGGMNAPLRFVDGDENTPGIGWVSETNSGFYWAGSGEYWATVLGTPILQFTENGLLIPSGIDLTVQGTVSFEGALNVVGNFSVATNKFTVAAASGNTTVAGTFVCAGAITATSGLTGNITSSSVTITGGNLNGVTIGGTTPGAGSFTTLASSSGLTGNVTGNVTGNLTGNVTASSGTSTFNNVTVNAGLDMTNGIIANLATPITGTDAATKAYVDSIAGVTSVGLTAPAVFTVSGSPVTTTGTLALTYSGTALPAANGGTAQTTYSTGDLLYASGANTLSKLPIGTSSQVLTVTAGVPAWGSSGSGSVTSVAQSFTGGLISVAGSPVTSSGTLALTVAGTSGGIPYFSSASTWATSAALTQYGVVYGGGAGAAPVATANGTTGQVLTATTGGAPSWASPATSGTVTSVAVSGGTTGLTTSGGPITGSGTITLAGTLAPANGGTGVANNAASTLTISGAFATTLTVTATTGVTLPTTGTLATLAGSETLTNKTLTSPTLTTPALGTPASGILSSCTVDGTNEVGFKNIPQNSQSAAYTLVLADAGKHIFHPSGDANARTYTIPANSSVAYPIGTALTFINMTSQVVTIAITTDTMYLSSAGTTGSRSLAQYGSATAIKMTSTTWLISGSGLT